jgi:cytochrome P450
MHRWDRLPGATPAVELHDDLSRLTLGVVARTLFDLDLAGEADSLHHAFVGLLEYLNYRLVHPFALPLFVPTPLNLRYKTAVRTIGRFVQTRVDQLRARPDRPGGTLLALLIEARDSAGRPLSDGRIREEVWGVFAAAQETTASALFWTLYLLARHPGHERRVLAEVGVLPARLSHEDLARMPFTRMAIDEAMRLYPPIQWLGRVAAEDDEIDGFRIPAGSPVVLGFYVAQRHPDFWDDPDTFNPDRFAQEGTNRPRGAYLPFGLGPRLCIGVHVAIIEALVVVASITRRFRLHVDDDGEVQPEVLATLRPRRGATVRLDRR